MNHVIKTSSDLRKYGSWVPNDKFLNWNKLHVLVSRHFSVISSCLAIIFRDIFINNFCFCFALLSDGSSHRLIFDRSLLAKQMNVVEPHGIMLLRGGQSNKEGKIYVFRLLQLDTINDPLSRYDLKDHRLERTRGTHLYAISRSGKQQQWLIITYIKLLH